MLVDKAGFAPLDPTGTQLCSASSPPPTNVAPSGSLALGVQRPGPLPAQTITAASMLDRLLHHAVVIVTDGDSYRMRTRGGGPTP